jgi:hypothetical protein
METDILQQYVSACKALLQEKSQLEGRLQQISQALDEAPWKPMRMRRLV